MAVACSGLDEAARALEMMGSPVSPAALQLDMEGLMLSLMRHPLSHILAEVSKELLSLDVCEGGRCQPIMCF